MNEQITTIEQENITQEQIEKVKRLEQLNIGPAQKAFIILVLLGLKPATELDLYEWNDKKEDIKKVMQEVGLEIKEKEIPSDRKNLKAKLAIAKDKTITERLLTIDSRKDHKEYGALMGYPESAVQAFINKEQLLSKDDYPKDEEVIFNMGLSKNNWQEEFAILKKWSETIKKYNPDLYDQLKGKSSI